MAKVNKAELIETVKRVALVAERNTAVQMKFGDNQIVLDAGSGDEAMATEAVDADINGDDLTTGFNPQFLLDGLTAIDGEFVDLAFTQATKPVVISGTDADDAPLVPLPADAAPPAELSSRSSSTSTARSRYASLVPRSATRPPIDGD